MSAASCGCRDRSPTNSTSSAQAAADAERRADGLADPFDLREFVASVARWLPAPDDQ